jgi:two-component system, cell cycle sensor histidine kinase and response regulator CckA
MATSPRVSTSIEQLFRLLTDAATDCSIVLLDPDGMVVSWPRAAEEIEGYTPQEVLGEHFSFLLGPGSRAQADDLLRQAAELGRYEVADWRIRKNGERFWANIVISAARNELGEITGFVRIVRDETSRRREEVALRESKELLEVSEQYFRRLIEHATDAITIVNPDGTVRYSSPALHRLLGYSPEERRGQSIFELIHPDDRAEAIRTFARVRNDKDAIITAQLRSRSKTGEWHCLDLTARNLLDDPIVNGIVINSRDVTEQKQAAQERARAEAELRTSEHRFRSLIENASGIVAIVDASANIIYTSPAMERITGYRPDDVRGINAFELVHPADLEYARKVLTQTLENPDRTVSAELRVRHKQGGWRVLDYRVRNMLASPAVCGIVVNAQDVTERRRSEEALRASEERYRSIIETASEGVIIRDDSDHMTFVNQRMADILGYTVEELIGRHIINIVCDEDRTEVSQMLKRGRGTGRHDADFRARRKDGSEVWGIVSSRPLYDADGSYAGALTMFLDITGRKQLEEQLRHSQKMEAIGRLAGGIAHDFNNLLTAIRGHAELLLGDMPVDHSLRADLEEINRAAERASSLTRQLLAFSRRQILQPRILDIDAVVTELERFIRRLIGEDVELVTNRKAAGARVRADRGQLEQVLMNLAVNARDAMPQGGTLTIETSTATLGEEYVQLHPAATPGDYVRLSVADTGVGMDARTLSHVFEPFFTTKGIGEGTGLGLATVYGIVKQSGGHIAVQSEVNVGSTFEIYLPKVKEAAEPAREISATTRDEGRGQTVLLAEDEDAVRSLAVRILRKHGYHVLEARDGLEALRVSDNYSGFIHVLLTDVVMPRMGGRELVERLLPHRPGLRVLYVSGYTDDALVHYGIVTDSSTWFLEKPFTPDALARKLREVIESD